MLVGHDPEPFERLHRAKMSTGLVRVVQAPSDLMMKAVGAFAAVQLAFLPVSGAAPPRAVAFRAPRSEQLHYGVDAKG